MGHLRKAAALLIMVLIILFGLPRILPTTSSLENYGFYPKRSEESTRLWASQVTQYAESVSCNTCHSDKYAAWSKSEHSGVNCESCHGPAESHVERGTSLVMATESAACGVCHDRVVARPSSFPQVDLAQHGGQSACVTCHNPHDPRIAAPPAVPHSLDGRADCLLCHNSGRIKPFPTDHAGRANSTCQSCHGSKQA